MAEKTDSSKLRRIQLVDQLRAETYSGPLDAWGGPIPHPLCHKAADVIEALLEALEALLAADRSDPYAIVGEDSSGHPLNAEGVARKMARAAIAKASGEQP